MQSTKPQSLISRVCRAIHENTPISIWGDGGNTKDYLFLDDFLDALEIIIDRGLTGTFNVASERSLSVQEIVSLVESLGGKKLARPLSCLPVGCRRKSNFCSEAACSYRMARAVRYRRSHSAGYRSRIEMRLSDVRQAVRGALALPARLAHARSLSAIRRSPKQHPVLSFGGMLKGGRLLHGGAVKLIHLRDAFACNEQSFNLLYLVSSAHPAFAEDLLKRCQRLKISVVWNQNGVAYPAWAGNDVERYNHPMRRSRAMANFVDLPERVLPGFRRAFSRSMRGG